MRIQVVCYWSDRCKRPCSDWFSLPGSAAEFTKTQLTKPQSTAVFLGVVAGDLESLLVLVVPAGGVCSRADVEGAPGPLRGARELTSAKCGTCSVWRVRGCVRAYAQGSVHEYVHSVVPWLQTLCLLRPGRKRCARRRPSDSLSPSSGDAAPLSVSASAASGWFM